VHLHASNGEDLPLLRRNRQIGESVSTEPAENHDGDAEVVPVAMAPDLPQISDEMYAAAGKAMVPWSDEEEIDLFEWHHCIDQPNCHGATEPCACSGMPWPSEPVRAAIRAALVASDWRREAG
jgi:hypothetical protein